MMYNRYIRNDHGTYTRIIEDDAPSAAASLPTVETVPRTESESGMPPPQSGNIPPRSENMPTSGNSARNPTSGNSARNPTSGNSARNPTSGNSQPDAPQSGRNADFPPSGPPPQSNTQPRTGQNLPPRHASEQHGPNSFHNNPFQNLFDAFQPEHMENGDLLLLALIFLLSRENADEEVLAALGLLLIL